MGETRLFFLNCAFPNMFSGTRLRCGFRFHDFKASILQCRSWDLLSIPEDIAEEWKTSFKKLLPAGHGDTVIVKTVFEVPWTLEHGRSKCWRIVTTSGLNVKPGMRRILGGQSCLGPCSSPISWSSKGVEFCNKLGRAEVKNHKPPQWQKGTESAAAIATTRKPANAVTRTRAAIAATRNITQHSQYQSIIYCKWWTGIKIAIKGWDQLKVATIS